MVDGSSLKADNKNKEKILMKKQLSAYEQFQLARKEGIDAINLLIGNAIEWVAEQDDSEDDNNSHRRFKEYVKNETNYNNVVEFAYEVFLKIDDEKSYGYVDAIVDAIREIMFIDNKPLDQIGKWDVFDKINY